MKHIPVLLNEVIDGLQIKSDGNYLDLTLGRAGHSSEILKRLDTGHLYGFDQDIEAINESQLILSKINNKFTLYHLNFIEAYETLKDLDVKFDGILMDLGVSSPQFDDGNRGFSYNHDGPLDMRMDDRNPLTAREIINTYPLEKIIAILRDYGEEKYAVSIARNIVKYRQDSSIDTTFQLVDIIKKSIPNKQLNKVGHPAKQTFQALRIAVNDELGVLNNSLKDIVKLLNNHGRLAVITFHSLEDRIVKQFFKSLTVIEGDRLDGPADYKQTDYITITRKPIVASEEELLVNNRSRSAKLRIIERK